MATQEIIFNRFRQTRELARTSRIFSFSSLSTHSLSFSELQQDVFLIGTSRPMRTSVVCVALSEHLSSCNVFILFIVLVDVCCSLAVYDNSPLHRSYGVFTPRRQNIIRRPLENPCTGIWQPKVIVALTMQEILDEHIAKKLV
jgi:hypothetical protein